MVKISIKKEEKTVKPRQNQKQKQKQSQRVIVNINSDLTKKRAPRRRQTLQRNQQPRAQPQQPTTIYVPQSQPIIQQPQIQQQGMGDLIKYLKDNEAQKQIIKEKDDKINELEKDKKNREKSKIITPEERQDNFLNVYENSTISSLPSERTTRPLSQPVNPNNLYERLRQISTPDNSFSNLSSLTTSGTATPLRSYNSFYNSVMRDADLGGENPNSGSISFSTFKTPREDLSAYIISQQPKDLSTYMTTRPQIELKELKPQNTYDALYEEEEDMQQVVLPEVVSAKEDPLLDQQLLLIEPDRTRSQTATATQRILGINDLNLPAFLRPINAPTPKINFKNIIDNQITVSETKNMREKRLQKFEPVLLIDNKASTPNDIPDFTPEELNKYKKLTQETKQAEEKPQEESEEEISRKEFINKLKGLENKELGQLLINNSIKGRKTDKEGYTNDFTINKAGVSMGGKTRNKDYLTNRLLTAYNDGLVKI